jgi:hypothetical protein
MLKTILKLLGIRKTVAKGLNIFTKAAAYLEEVEAEARAEVEKIEKAIAAHTIRKDSHATEAADAAAARENLKKIGLVS